MDLLEILLNIEKELDDQMQKLRVWELPFQTVLSCLLLTIDNIDLNGRLDTSMDYASRLSYVYRIVKQRSAQAPVTTTAEAILKIDDSVMEDFNFINAYAHFCLLMPQVRKGIMTVSAIDEGKICLSYPSDEIRHAESIDRLYGYMSLQMNVAYPYDEDLQKWIDNKITEYSTSIVNGDFFQIKKIYDHYCRYFILIKPLPDSIFEKTLGVSYEEYYKLSAACRSFMDYFIYLSRAYYKAATANKDENASNFLMSGYMEWAVCCITHKAFGWVAGMCDVDITKLNSFLKYYLQIYSNETGESYKENSFCGEGFFPPFTLIESSLIFSPHVCRYMLTVNNILYSINKLQTKVFDEEVSKHLEPALICQIEYVFGHFPDVEINKNINYPGGEIDMIVFSAKENTALCIQVKSTIAPDSSRTVERVTDRVLEGINQIIHFEKLAKDTKQQILNDAMSVSASATKIINLAIVRSCAGFAKSWSYNNQYKIINYALLAWLISEKIKKGDLNILNFDHDIENAQELLIKKGEIQEVFQKLKIGKYAIEFPNLDCSFQNVAAMNAQTFIQLRDFENVICK